MSVLFGSKFCDDNLHGVMVQEKKTNIHLNENIEISKIWNLFHILSKSWHFTF